MSRNNHTFLTIGDLLRLCLHKWRWFVIFLAIFLLFAVLDFARTPKRYTSHASLLVKEESLGTNAGKGNGEEFSDLGLVKQKSNLPNEVRHLASLDVLMEVARRLRPEADEATLLALAQGFQGNFSAERESDKSSVISLSYNDASPEQAVKMLSLIIEVYNDKWLEDQYLLTNNTSQFIDNRLLLLEEELDRVDDSISTYKSRYGITDLSSVSDIYLKQQSESDAQILILSNQKAMAEYIRDLIEKDKKGRQLLIVNSGINNPVIESQITQYNTLLMQLNSHLTYTSDQNPLIVNLENEIAALRKSILASVENHIKTLDIELRALRGYHHEATAKISSNPAQAKFLTSIEREQKVKESLYLYLLQKKEENEISITYSNPNTRIIDIPHCSSRPTSPKVLRILFAAILLGLLVPLTLIFLQATLDETVHSRRDLEANCELPLLGEVPGAGRKEIEGGLVVVEGRQSLSNDAFRTLRTRLCLMASEGEQVFLVASAEPGTGKTFVSMNLAQAFALGGKKILLMDGDLRRAGASRLWKAGEKGLADYLEGKESDVLKCISRREDCPGLEVLPAGHLPGDPAQLLQSPRFSALMTQLRARYEMIIIDSPSSRLIADSEVLLRQADSVFFLLRAGWTPRSVLSGLDGEAAANGKRMYLVLNDIA